MPHDSAVRPLARVARPHPARHLGADGVARRRKGRVDAARGAVLADDRLLVKRRQHELARRKLHLVRRHPALRRAALCGRREVCCHDDAIPPLVADQALHTCAFPEAQTAAAAAAAVVSTLPRPRGTGAASVAVERRSLGRCSLRAAAQTPRHARPSTLPAQRGLAQGRRAERWHRLRLVRLRISRVATKVGPNGAPWERAGRRDQEFGGWAGSHRQRRGQPVEPGAALGANDEGFGSHHIVPAAGGTAGNTDIRPVAGAPLTARYDVHPRAFR
mmetsp:Transcript_18542/g.54636  ORF Transcript_18542/g.54636 Transcript_18542/m.54636 type:complete len:274 (+) Transcript_18542:462-1283(+)